MMKSSAAILKIFRTVCLLFLPIFLICDAWVMVVPTSTFHNAKANTPDRHSDTTTSNVNNMNSHLYRRRSNSARLYDSTDDNTSTESTSCNVVKINDLNDMDVVVYSLARDRDDGDDENSNLFLGALQENGVLSPLSAWTDEPAFGDSIEFLVDEVDRFSLAKETEEQRKNDIDENNTIIRIHHLLSEAEVSYSARQCPRGVHNPHGEESELLYYIDQELIDQFRVNVSMKPELEILW